MKEDGVERISETKLSNYSTNRLCFMHTGSGYVVLGLRYSSIAVIMYSGNISEAEHLFFSTHIYNIVCSCFSDIFIV